MQNFIQQNLSNIVFLVLGGLLGWLTTHLYRSKKQLYIQIDNQTIFQKNTKYPEGLEINYLKKPISSLSKTYYYVWNNGNTTIKKDDIAIGDLLRCKVSSSVCLIDTNATISGREACGVKITRHAGFVDVSFDFLDKNDGFRFALIHDAEKAPLLDGTIAGTKKLTSHENIISNKAIFISIITTLLIIATMLPSAYLLIAKGANIASYVAGFILIGLVVTFFICTKPWKQKVPPKHLVK